MRILGHLDRLGPPVGGGVVTTVTLLRELACRGHHVRIVTNRQGSLVLPGVEVLDAAPPRRINLAYCEAQVVIAHMNVTHDALKRARRAGVPVVYPVYDDGQLDLFGLTPDDIALAVFCSCRLKERTEWAGRSLVVYPPVIASDHRVEHSGDAISISSLSAEKGGELFWQLVDRMPERRFIGVVGGWGEQIIPDSVPPNAEIRNHDGADLRNLFGETWLLLAPSQQLGDGGRFWTENWGRAAIEAACTGIPTIASPAPGPLESLGESGIFCDRGDVDSWIRAIRSLDDPEAYRRQSELVRARVEELEWIVTHQLDALEFELQRICSTASSYPDIPLDRAGYR